MACGYDGGFEWPDFISNFMVRFSCVHVGRKSIVLFLSHFQGGIFLRHFLICEIEDENLLVNIEMKIFFKIILKSFM